MHLAWLHFAGDAIHASQQLNKHGPVITNSSASQHAAGSSSQQAGGSRHNAALDMSGERISGSSHPPTGPSSDRSGHGSDAAWSSAHDDVELEKSNILMLGPTGGLIT